MCRRLGRVVFRSCGSFLNPGGIVCIIAIPPCIAPTFCTSQLLTALRNVVVSKVCVDGVVTTVFGMLRHAACLSTRRLSCPESDVCSMSWHTRCRVHSGLQALSRASRCPWNVSHRPRDIPRAGGGVSAKRWLRENALDAHERSATQGFTRECAWRIRGIPWLSSAVWSAPTPLPEAWRTVSRANAVWRCRR